MEIEQLKICAENAVRLSKEDLSVPPLFYIEINKFASGEKLRIAKGLTGIVVTTQPQPPKTICLLDGNKVLKFIKSNKL